MVTRTGPWAGDLVMPAFQGYWPRWRQAIGTGGALRRALLRRPTAGARSPTPARSVGCRACGRSPPTRAVAEVVRRYLHAYGPATPTQLAQWLAARPGGPTALFDGARRRAGAGRTWRASGPGSSPATTAAAGGPPSGVRLLPYFDAYVVGSHPRGLALPRARRDRALHSRAGRPATSRCCSSTAWRPASGTRSGPGRRVELTVEPLRRLPAARRRELRRPRRAHAGAILAAEPRLTIGHGDRRRARLRPRLRGRWRRRARSFEKTDDRKVLTAVWHRTSIGAAGDDAGRRGA